jgi:hypothetical protein
MRKIVLLLGFVCLIISCKSTGLTCAVLEDEARVMIYKTRTDHFHQVPITLNEGKDQLSSFPHPSDLFHEGQLALPIKLNDGFLLDRRGISIHTAFTSYTYEAYSKLENPPSPQELLKSVIDSDPFEVFYDCGKAGSYDNLVKELNQKIAEGME